MKQAAEFAVFPCFTPTSPVMLIPSELINSKNCLIHFLLTVLKVTRQLVMDRRADCDFNPSSLNRPVTRLQTSPLINENSPSNDPDDNETISRRARQLTRPLTLNLDR